MMSDKSAISGHPFIRWTDFYNYYSESCKGIKFKKITKGVT